jgi:iron complex outermembrane receptor protein
MAEAEESGTVTEPVEKVASSTAKRRAVDEGIEEIIVTATKRETRLQETAVAVTALTDESLERQQVVDLKSVTALVPNLQIGAHSDSAAIDVSLRGIVSTNRTELGDPAVAFHVDGFYSPRPQGATTLLYDLERIEVLRGPQGTLFGRNANAGVINVSTAKPSFDASSASADMTVGDYDLFRIKGHLNAPISERFAIRGAVYADRRDGFIKFQPGSKVPVGADRYDNSDKTSYRLSALWEPLDNLRVFLSGEQFVDKGAGTIPVLIDPREGTKLRSALVDSAGELDMRNTTFHGRIDYKPVSWLELSYLGGYGRMTRRNVSDNDAGFNPGDNFQQEHRTEWSKFLSQSHELQIKTVDTEYIDAIVGGFYYREDNKIRFDIDINDDPDGDLVPDQYWAMSFIQPERILDSLAAFGQVTWHVMDMLRLTGGARYTTDTKSDDGGRNLVCPNFGTTFDDGGVNLKDIDGLPLAPDIFADTPFPDGTCGSFPGNTGNDVKKTWKKLTWMGRVEVDPINNLLIYGLVNTGFKSGVIQDGGITADPEYVTNYELGAKATLLGGRLNVNPVAFYSDYTDILRSRAELQTDGSQQLVTRNATEARIFGVETEVTWFASAADLFQLMVSYLNAEYEDFPNIDNVLYATDDPLSPVINLEGNKLPFSPEFSVAAAYEHSFELSNGASIVPRIQTQFQAEMYLGDFNRDSDRQKAFSRTDLSIRYVTQSGWIAEVFVKNVEDSAVKSNVEIKGNSPGGGGVPGDPGYAFAYYDAPRTFGARLSYTWNDL